MKQSTARLYCSIITILKSYVMIGVYELQLHYYRDRILTILTSIWHSFALIIITSVQEMQSFCKFYFYTVSPKR